MEEDPRPIKPLEEEVRAHTHGSTYSELVTKITPNGHSISTNKDKYNDKRVDPLRIRIGPKLHPKYGQTLKPQIITNALNTETILDKTSHLADMKKGLPSAPKNAQKSSIGRFHSGSLKGMNIPVKRLKTEKGEYVKEYAQSLGLQPTVKFKCRKCSSMSFKSLVMLKEHQRLCKAQTGRGEKETTVTNSTTAPGRVMKKVYLCSSCSTYYESWNLFLHMRQVHNRHICLYCLGMFSKAERLTSHLFLKHGVAEQMYTNKEDFEITFGGIMYLTCCSCDKLYTEKDNYLIHSCVGSASIISSDKIHDNINVIPAHNASLDPKTNEVTIEESTSHINDMDTSNISLAKTDEFSNDDVSVPSISPIHSSDKSPNVLDQSNESAVNVKMSLSGSTNEEPPSLYTQDNISQSLNNESQNVPTDSVISTNQESESVSSDDLDDSSSICIDSPKHENNNIANEKVKEVGIKLTLSLNNASSPVIINSTVRPEQEPKPLIRPNRPPGGRIVAPGEPIPPPASVQSNILTTIYDNKSEEVNTMNRVPKLTVRVPKGLLDKDSSSEESSDSDVSDKLTVDDTVIPDNKEIVPETSENAAELIQSEDESASIKESTPIVDSEEVSKNPQTVQSSVAPVEDEIPATEITLDRPLDKYPLKELLKVCVLGSMYYCVYCNHVRKIAVNCKQLALHVLDTHRFSATVNSITAEELLPETIKQKINTDLDEVQSIFVNLDTYDSVNPVKLLPYVRTYECFQCYFITTVHKDLYFHNRKMHQKTILLCVMCKSNFYSYSELLCHLCPGTYDSEYEMKFRCCMCNMDNIPSAFRLMVHMRKVHHACDVCTEICHTQSLLSTHVWKHKLHHLCYRCGIAYRNKADITKHLFWKHGTESVLCKKCLQKKWPHVYHFCVPPTSFACEECNETFTRAVCLKVHKRFHLQIFPHLCSEEGCQEKFVSSKLLHKHMIQHVKPKTEEQLSIHQEKMDAITENAEEAIKISENDVTFKAEEKFEIVKAESESLEASKKIKKKKNKNKDSFLLDVNLPALNLSESDSSDESELNPVAVKITDEKPKLEEENDENDKIQLSDLILENKKEEKECDQSVLDIWDNFKQYQAKIEKQKSPPLTVIRKHVCESDHDYCLIPNESNGDSFSHEISDKQPKKKSPKKKVNKNNTRSSSSSSSSSSSDSCCSRGSKCSCSSSSGSSSSSSSDSDSSTSLRDNLKKITKTRRRASNASHSSVDVMAVEEHTTLVPEKKPSPIPETDLETEESDTDEEFYDKHPQRLANRLHSEKKNQLMLLASVAPSDNGSIMEDLSRPVTPEKIKSPKKKRKTKKRKKSAKIKEEPIKLNIPKDVIGQSRQPLTSSLNSNKITISLHSKSVQIPNIPKPMTSTQMSASQESKRASKRRRVPNRFYGYSSDEESAAKSQPPIRNELKKRYEEYSPQHFPTKPQPTFSHKIPSYNEPITRMSTPVPDPVPPSILMNTEHMDSSDSSSDENELKIDHSNVRHNSIPVPSPFASGSGSGYLPVNFPAPVGTRQARAGESVYCYCRCPYDEVSEMIACDAIGCAIEWFHFECVGIMVPPKGKWYCPDCRQKQGFI